MLLSHLTTIVFLLCATFHPLPTRADHLSRISCDCNSQVEAWDIYYTSSRLHVTQNFHKMGDPSKNERFGEVCTHFTTPSNDKHEFCYNRNFITRDDVRLDSPKKIKLPKNGRSEWKVYDCTRQCREWFGMESSCNRTSGYWHHNKWGEDEWVTLVEALCRAKGWEFPDL